jgi:hypothetical protein
VAALVDLGVAAHKEGQLGRRAIWGVGARREGQLGRRARGEEGWRRSGEKEWRHSGGAAAMLAATIGWVVAGDVLWIRS